MKVDRNLEFKGLPLRLQIATQLLYLDHSGDAQVAAADVPRHVASYLRWADALIAAHNATCEETPQ